MQHTCKLSWYDSSGCPQRGQAPALHLTSKFQCNNIFAFQKSLQTETEVTIMSDTNFYDSLSAFAASQPLRMCMPGHKGRRMPMEEWDALAPLDFTELPPTGNLYGGDDWLEDSQRLWAWDWGMNAAFYATGGSTQGIFTLLNLFTRPGDTVLLDRVSHKSIHHALSLFDLRPVWLPRPWDGENAVTGPLTGDILEGTFKKYPDAKAVVVTSPTYYGVLSDLDELGRICHAHGAKLLVDGAHGAHLPLVLEREPNCLLGYNPYKNVDGVTVSAHKTLPAPGQTAVVFANGVRLEALKAASALTSTTSPSYAMLAALDKLRPWMYEGRGSYRRVAAWCADLRRAYPCLRREDLDPCRLVFQVEDGYQLEADLQKFGIYPEMADNCHVVCILTAADTERDFLRLKRALNYLGLKGKVPYLSELSAPPIPEQAMTPRQAQFAGKEKIRLRDAVGRVAADVIAPYPPGVPVAAPGEVITEKIRAYLYDLCYDENSVIMIVKD